MSTDGQVCRTCLRPDNLSPIFTRAEHHERYTVALFLTTGLQIEINDGLPQTICKDCRELVNVAIEFRNQGHRSEEMLLRWGFSRVTQSQHEQRMKEFYQHVDLKLSTKDNLKKEETAIGESKEDPFKVYGETVKVEFVGSDEEKDEKPFKNTLKNENDSNEYETKVEFEAHSLSDDDDNYELDDSTLKWRKSCWSEDSFEFEYDEQLTNQKKPRKRGPKLDRFKSYAHLLDQPMGRPGPYKCTACGKVLKNWCSFRCHAKLHAGLQFMCEYCGKTFATVTMLKRHGMSQHDMERTYRCRYCDHATWDTERLKIHERRMHTGEKPYICDTCGKGFFDRAYIVHHMAVHLTEKNVECPRCPSRFKTKQQLLCHTAHVHNPRGPRVECYICHKTYATQGNFREHMLKIHGFRLPVTNANRGRKRKPVEPPASPEQRALDLNVVVEEMSSYAQPHGNYTMLAL